MKRLQLAGYQAKHFGYQVDGKVATITLNRPDRKNPLTFDSYGELRDLFREMNYATDIKAIVFAGENGGAVASQLAGLTKVPAIVKEFDDRAVRELALIENIQREELNPIDEARLSDANR